MHELMNLIKGELSKKILKKLRRSAPAKEEREERKTSSQSSVDAIAQL